MSFKALKRSGAVHIELFCGQYWCLSCQDGCCRIQRSGFPCPPDPPSHIPTNLTEDLRKELVSWLAHAKTASEVLRAAIHDDFARACFLNVQNFRYQLMKSGGVLDQQVLRAALGKRQPRQRMWGLSGPAVLGVALALHVSRMEDTLALLQ